MDELVPGDWLVGRKRDDSPTSQIIVAVTRLVPDSVFTKSMVCVYWLEDGEIHHNELLAETLVVKDDADGFVTLLRDDDV
jgi:hypothetical protein